MSSFVVVCLLWRWLDSVEERGEMESWCDECDAIS